MLNIITFTITWGVKGYREAINANSKY